MADSADLLPAGSPRAGKQMGTEVDFRRTEHTNKLVYLGVLTREGPRFFSLAFTWCFLTLLSRIFPETLFQEKRMYLLIVPSSEVYRSKPTGLVLQRRECSRNN